MHTYVLEHEANNRNGTHTAYKNTNYRPQRHTHLKANVFRPRLARYMFSSAMLDDKKNIQ